MKTETARCDAVRYFAVFACDECHRRMRVFVRVRPVTPPRGWIVRTSLSEQHYCSDGCYDESRRGADAPEPNYGAISRGRITAAGFKTCRHCEVLKGGEHLSGCTLIGLEPTRDRTVTAEDCDQ